MRVFVLATLAALVLAGCAQSTLVVRGNTGLEHYIAKAAIAIHSSSEARAETREVKVEKRNHETYTYVKQDRRY